MIHSIATYKMILAIMYILVASSYCASIGNTQLEDSANQEETNIGLENQYDLEDDKLLELILSNILSHHPHKIINSFENNEVNKRELKRQGILERMKNKMDHDLSKFGWD